MLTTAQIIQVAKVSSYLASVDVANGALFGAPPQPALPQIIYAERKSVEWLYDLDPTNAALFGAGEYLLSLCGKYALAANSTIVLTEEDPIEVIEDFLTDGEQYIISN